MSDNKSNSSPSLRALHALLETLKRNAKSTREIVMDSVGEAVNLQRGPRTFGHNPSWVKLSDVEAAANDGETETTQSTDLSGLRLSVYASDGTATVRAESVQEAAAPASSHARGAWSDTYASLIVFIDRRLSEGLSDPSPVASWASDLRTVRNELEAALVSLTPTEQPASSNGRFLLNAYGRECYARGIETGKLEAALQAVPSAEKETT